MTVNNNLSVDRDNLYATTYARCEQLNTLASCLTSASAFSA